MNFSELLTEIKKLKFQETRADRTDYFEGVAKMDLIPDLTTALQNYFGVAAKPAGQPSKGKDQQVSSPYGGIQKNQTLYWSEQKIGELAMLWPWGDGASVTLKIARH